MFMNIPPPSDDGHGIYTNDSESKSSITEQEADTEHKNLLQQLHVGALPDDGHGFAYPEAVPDHLVHFAKGDHHTHEPIAYNHKTFEGTKFRQVSKDLDKMIHIVNPDIDVAIAIQEEEERNSHVNGKHDGHDKSRKHRASHKNGHGNGLPPLDPTPKQQLRSQLPAVFFTPAQYQVEQKTDLEFHASSTTSNAAAMGRKLTTKEERALLNKYQAHEEKVLEKLVADALDKYHTATLFVIQREISLRRVKQLIKQLSNIEKNLGFSKLAARELTTLAKELKALGLKCVEKVSRICFHFYLLVFIFTVYFCNLLYRLHFGSWRKKK